MALLFLLHHLSLFSALLLCILTLPPLSSVGHLFILRSSLEERRIPPYVPHPSPSPGLHTVFFLSLRSRSVSFFSSCFPAFFICSSSLFPLILPFLHSFFFLLPSSLPPFLPSFFLPSFLLSFSSILPSSLALLMSLCLSPTWLFKSCLPSDVPMRRN